MFHQLHTLTLLALSTLLHSTQAHPTSPRQQILQSLQPPTPLPPYAHPPPEPQLQPAFREIGVSSELREAAQNSVGVVFTFLAMEDSEEWVGERGGEGDEGLGDGVREVEERVHFWLPLGKRVWCRDVPALPLHPLAARITTMIHSTAELAGPEVLGQVGCQLHFRDTVSSPDSKVEARDLAATGTTVTLKKLEELVRLVDAGSWIGARSVDEEVEAGSGDERVWVEAGELEWVECS